MSKKEFAQYGAWHLPNDSTCERQAFRLTPQQSFLKSFMSPKTPYKGLLLFHSVGTGKCHAANTPILMHDGAVKMVQDVRVGDLLMGDDSTPRRVLSLASGEDDLYDVVPIAPGFDKYTVNSEHVLCLRRKIDGRDIIEIEVRDFIRLPESDRKALEGYRAGVDAFGGPDVILPSDPYLFGRSCLGLDSLPPAFLRSSRENRSRLLAGILDAAAGPGREVAVASDAAAADLLFLARSLGLAASRPSSRRVIIQQTTTTGIEVAPAGRGSYYGFTLDGNNRYLLGDFTVTHNTCTALSIAEQFPGARAFVVVPNVSIRESFAREIHDPSRVPPDASERAARSMQCLGKKYRSLEPSSKYSFQGMIEMANFINKTLDSLNGPKYLAKLYSDSLLIVDEAHHLRTENEFKVVTPALKKLLMLCKNVRLILLTATPMFNDPRDMVDLLNLLLLNDRQPELAKSELFDEDGRLQRAGYAALPPLFERYVSFSGKDRDAALYPLRLGPSHSRDPRVMRQFPSRDLSGSTMPRELRIKSLELIGTPMSAAQYQLYRRIGIGRRESAEDLFTSSLFSDALQIGNVVFQGGRSYGQAGFNATFRIADARAAHLTLEYAKESFGRVLEGAALARHAPKMHAVLDYLQRCEGIAVVYSRFISSGIIPMAIALEHAGYERYAHPNLLDSKQKRSHNRSLGLHYCILSSDKYMDKIVCPDLSADLAAVNREDNKDGSRIKVVLMSDVAIEGLNLFRVREIHLLEPWYNMNKIEQVVGRAYRRCSHVDLPPPQRNLTVYLHAATRPPPDQDVESYDLRAYRFAELKRDRIEEMERLVRAHAIDADAGFDGERREDRSRASMITSQGARLSAGQVLAAAATGDNGSNMRRAPAFAPRDASTYDPGAHHPRAEDFRYAVGDALSESGGMTFEELLEKLGPRFRIDANDMAHVLSSILKEDLPLFRGDDRGRLVVRGSTYAFEPLARVDQREKPAKRVVIKNKNNRSVAHATAKGSALLDKLERQIDLTMRRFRRIFSNSAEYRSAVTDYYVDRLSSSELLVMTATVLAFDTGFVYKHLIKSMVHGGILHYVRDDILLFNPSNSLLYCWKEGKLAPCPGVPVRSVASEDDVRNRVHANAQAFVVHQSAASGGKFKLTHGKVCIKTCVCNQTSSVKADMLRDMIASIAPRKDIQDLPADKNTLCVLYELVLRKHRPEALTRPGWARLLVKLRQEADGQSK